MKYRTKSIMPPPITKLHEAAKAYIGSPRFLNLGQGVPGHIPTKSTLDVLSERIMHPSAHRYTPDQGLLELREELALRLRQTMKIHVDPFSELTITAGGNAAFAGAILTLLEPGERVIMSNPYYFNSVMAVRLCGGEVIGVPVDEEFQPSIDKIEEAIDTKTRAILLVSPNNPTGAVYERNVVDRLLDICIENDLMLISDETYSRMVFEGAEHYSPRSRRNATNNVITLGSFSKDYGMSGWRVGYVIGPPEFTEEFLKVQDTITICAPTAGQILALEVLKSGQEQVEEEMERLSLLRDLAYLRIHEIDDLQAVRTKGTFYMFPRVAGCTDSRNLVLDILQSAEMLVLPGSIFGESGEGHIRLSVGPLTPEAVDEAFNRLGAYFRHR